MPVTVDHIKDVYLEFRKAQAHFSNRGYRMPKDFEDHFNNKFREQNKKSLIKITGWFLTKWGNIDPYEYFLCGFQLYDKRFSYHKFFKDKIILLYKTKDKNRKREVRITKKALVESASFVKKWMVNNNTTINDYISNREGNRKLAVKHYLNNKIDAAFFVFLMRKGMLLTDTDRSLIPYIQKNYRKIMFGLEDIKDFITKLEGKL